MHIVDARTEAPLGWKEGLSIGKDRGVYRSRHYSIEIVIDHDFNQPLLPIRHGSAQRQNLMAAMAPAALRARRADRRSTNHHVIDRPLLACVQQIKELLIHLRCAG